MQPIKILVATLGLAATAALAQPAPGGLGGPPAPTSSGSPCCSISTRTRNRRSSGYCNGATRGCASRARTRARRPTSGRRSRNGSRAASRLAKARSRSSKACSGSCRSRSSSCSWSRARTATLSGRAAARRRLARRDGGRCAQHRADAAHRLARCGARSRSARSARGRRRSRRSRCPATTATFASREQLLGELDRAQRAIGLGDLAPRRTSRPSGISTIQPASCRPLHQHVAALLVLRARSPRRTPAALRARRSRRPGSA